jgi:hypothetical protein
VVIIVGCMGGDGTGHFEASKVHGYGLVAAFCWGLCTQVYMGQGKAVIITLETSPSHHCSMACKLPPSIDSLNVGQWTLGVGACADECACIFSCTNGQDQLSNA